MQDNELMLRDFGSPKIEILEEDIRPETVVQCWPKGVGQGVESFITF